MSEGGREGGRERVSEWPQEVFLNLSTAEDMAVSCCINAFKLTLTALSTVMMVEFLMGF